MQRGDWLNTKTVFHMRGVFCSYRNRAFSSICVSRQYNCGRGFPQMFRRIRIAKKIARFSYSNNTLASRFQFSEHIRDLHRVCLEFGTYVSLYLPDVLSTPTSCCTCHFVLIKFQRPHTLIPLISSGHGTVAN